MSEYWTNGVTTLHQADARAMPLPDASVHCVVTSPPYWGLRDYGLGQWQGGDAECGHKNPLEPSVHSTLQNPHQGGDMGWTGGVCGPCGAIQQPTGIGLEPTLGEWVANIVAVMREVKRVLRDDGSLWLNLGDSYHDKQLLGQPWRVAFALQDDGWLLRSAIVWHKPNPMPESVTDRPTNAYEMVFLLSKQGRYFYDAEAIREPASIRSGVAGGKNRDESRKDSDSLSLFNMTRRDYSQRAQRLEHPDAGPP